MQTWHRFFFLDPKPCFAGTAGVAGPTGSAAAVPAAAIPAADPAADPAPAEPAPLVPAAGLEPPAGGAQLLRQPGGRPGGHRHCGKGCGWWGLLHFLGNCSI
jgi:hypothetical protein